jgi:hypothetical protein
LQYFYDAFFLLTHCASFKYKSTVLSLSTKQ